MEMNSYEPRLVEAYQNLKDCAVQTHHDWLKSNPQYAPTSLAGNSGDISNLWTRRAGFSARKTKGYSTASS
jgi:hypothetical protein